MQDRAAEAVKPCDLERVAVAQHPQEGVELGPAGLGAASVIDINVLGGHAGADERVDLVVRVLLGGRDARVPEEHGVENTGPAGIFVVDSRREFSTVLSIEWRLAGRASTNERFPSTPLTASHLKHRAATATGAHSLYPHPASASENLTLLLWSDRIGEVASAGASSPSIVDGTIRGPWKASG
jgi:hypothetical protein